MSKFTYCEALDTKIRYATVAMCPESQHISMISHLELSIHTLNFTWVWHLPEFYQEMNSLLLIDLEEVKVNFDYIFVLSFDFFEDQLLTKEEMPIFQ